MSRAWNVLVPTGTSAFSEPAAFVTAALYVSPNGEYAIEYGRRTDQILYTKICHETDWIHNGREGMAFIRVELLLDFRNCTRQKGQTHSSKHRNNRHVPDSSKR